MKKWCKILETEVYDFLILCSDEALHITFMNENETIDALYNPKQNTDARQLFENDEKLLKICLELLEEITIHYEN